MTFILFSKRETIENFAVENCDYGFGNENQDFYILNQSVASDFSK